MSIAHFLTLQDMITIISVGSVKKPWDAVVEEYTKRLSPYTRITLITIPEESFKSSDEKEKVTKKEAEKVIKMLKTEKMVLLTAEGTIKTSDQFEAAWQAWHREDVTLVIAGPLGVHEMLRARATSTVSLSPLTITHQMALAVLLEQCYRTVMREKGKYDY